jgi:hypothetical protein
MNSRISELLEEIRKREEELAELIQSSEAKILYQLDGKKIRFEQAVRQAQQQLKVGMFRWLRESKPRNVLSAPVIYSMIVPLAFLDLAVSVYQYLCFPLYKIARVRRSKYVLIDRHHLPYLNSIEKLNCAYCGYVNGLISYSREIVARTEQYWCPVKHAHKVLDPHRRYARFAAFGDAEAYQSIISRRDEIDPRIP